MPINLLQIVMHLCGVMALDVHLAIVRKYSTGRRRVIVNVALVASFVVPLVCLVACYALDNGVAFKALDASRNAFTCEPRLKNATLEWAFIHAHFILGAFFAAVTSAATARHLLSASTQARQGEPEAARKYSATGSMMRALSRVVGKLQRSQSMRPLVMSAMTSSMLLIYTAVNIFTSSTLEIYTNGLEDLLGKIVHQTATVEEPEPDGRPPVAIRALLCFSLACAPLLNGIVFAKVECLSELVHPGGAPASNHRAPQKMQAMVATAPGDDRPDVIVTAT
jgi:hypothetical protein